MHLSKAKKCPAMCPRVSRCITIRGLRLKDHTHFGFLNKEVSDPLDMVLACSVRGDAVVDWDVALLSAC